MTDAERELLMTMASFMIVLLENVAPKSAAVLEQATRAVRREQDNPPSSR